MLMEVMCDKFIDHNIPRGRIQFHKGLNIVMGDEIGTNSIGKSTFLMIIDFIFGGDDYINKLPDVKEEVGNHRIYFAFEFNNVRYYFSRSTNKEECNKVQQCDRNYVILNDQSMSLHQYLEFLQKNYNLDLPELTFRNAVGRSMRIYKRETLDEEHPLHQAKQETAKSAIEGLLKLTNLYAEIEEQAKIAADIKDRFSSFKKAQKYHYIPIAMKKTDFEKNEENIKELSNQAQELIDKSSKGLLDLNSFQIEKVSYLKGKLTKFKRQRSSLISKLESIQMDKDLNIKLSRQNYIPLLEFFPNVNLKRISDIDGFHRQISKILKKEIADTKVNLQSAITLLDSKINEIEEEIACIGESVNLPKMILDQYVTIDKKLKQCEIENKNYITMNELSDESKKQELKYNQLVIEKMTKMQRQINDEMKRINDYIYSGETTAPNLDIKDSTHYKFFTPKDGGTGTQYKGLIVFDLAMLNLSPLPLLVHDSVMLKQIQDSAIEKILELYANSSKQVFIAMDKKSSYSVKAQKIMEKSIVIQLSAKEGALFGKAWNQIKQ